MEYISTTSLANNIDIPLTELFSKLKGLGWIERKNDKWILTDIGKQKGGQTRNNPKFGEFIVWPENIIIGDNQSVYKNKLVNATTIGKHFKISSQRLNLILAELGWIEKDIAGWSLTNLGKALGGKKFEHETSGGTYVLWPENILTNKYLVNVFKEPIEIIDRPKTQNIDIDSKEENHQKGTLNDFRKKYPANHRTKDGHLVRSRAEVIIDNALYDYNLAHAYERKLPIEEDLLSDFYIPSEQVYIEYWGLEDDPKYLERKKVKKEIYQKHGFKLIELTDEDILNLDDNLPRKLLKYNIKVF